MNSEGADSVLPFSNINYGTFNFNSSGNIDVNLGTKPKDVYVVFGTKTSTNNQFCCYSEGYPSINNTGGRLTITDTGFKVYTNNPSSISGAKGYYMWL